MVIYDVEDDWARVRVAEACKDFGLERVQYSCFRGKLSRNKREEVYERLRKIQRDWELRWRKDFPDARLQPTDSPDIPEHEANGRWSPAFKILIQPLCEKDVGAASYAYLYVDVSRSDGENERQKGKRKKGSRRSSKADGEESEEQITPREVGGSEVD